MAVNNNQQTTSPDELNRQLSDMSATLRDVLEQMSKYTQQLKEAADLTEEATKKQEGYHKAKKKYNSDEERYLFDASERIKKQLEGRFDAIDNLSSTEGKKFKNTAGQIRSMESQKFYADHKGKSAQESLSDFLKDNFQKEQNRIDIEKKFAKYKDSDGNFTDIGKKQEYDKLMAKYAQKLDVTKIFGDSKMGKFAGDLAGKVAGSELGKAASVASAKLAAAAPYLAAILAAVKFMTKVMETLSKKTQEGIDKANAIIGQAGGTDARLYGLKNKAGDANLNFVELVTDAINVAGNSPFVNSEELSKSIITLANQGIAYNLEQKALWNTMKDKIVSTFDVTNAYLLRMIKLKERELTADYMGVEAAVTRILNGVFQDTQYLQDQYDTVFSAMTNALSLVEDPTIMGYTTQKWLGSLSSVGLDDSVTSNWANALNALLTGDLSSIQDADRTLFAMAASRANISYADLLVKGSDKDQMNELMKSVIELLQNIYQTNKTNHVVLSEWGNVFGLKSADWVAINNMTPEIIQQLYEDKTTSDDLRTELMKIETNLVSERTLTAERIENVISNAMFRVGWNVASDASDYTSWRMGQIKSQLDEELGLGIFADIRKFFTWWSQGVSSLQNGILDSLNEIYQAGNTAAASNAYLQFYQDKNGNLPFDLYGQLFTSQMQLLTGGKIPTFDDLKNGSYFISNGHVSIAAPQVITQQQQVQTAQSSTQVSATAAEPQTVQQVSNAEDKTVSEEYSEYNVTDIYRALFVTKVPIHVRLSSALGSVISNLAENNIINQEQWQELEEQTPVDSTINEVTEGG